MESNVLIYHTDFVALVNANFSTQEWPICKGIVTSSNENIFRVIGPWCGEFTVTGEYPSKTPVTRSFNVFFELHLNTHLSKQLWGWWFEMPSRSLWRHCNGHGCTELTSTTMGNHAAGEDNVSDAMLTWRLHNFPLIMYIFAPFPKK